MSFLSSGWISILSLNIITVICSDTDRRFMSTRGGSLMMTRAIVGLPNPICTTSSVAIFLWALPPKEAFYYFLWMRAHIYHSLSSMWCLLPTFCFRSQTMTSPLMFCFFYALPSSPSFVLPINRKHQFYNHKKCGGYPLSRKS